MILGRPIPQAAGSLIFCTVFAWYSTGISKWPKFVFKKQRNHVWYPIHFYTQGTALWYTFFISCCLKFLEINLSKNLYTHPFNLQIFSACSPDFFWSISMTPNFFGGARLKKFWVDFTEYPSYQFSGYRLNGRLNTERWVPMTTSYHYKHGKLSFWNNETHFFKVNLYI